MHNDTSPIKVDVSDPDSNVTDRHSETSTLLTYLVQGIHITKVT